MLSANFVLNIFQLCDTDQTVALRHCVIPTSFSFSLSCRKRSFICNQQLSYNEHDCTFKYTHRNAWRQRLCMWSCRPNRGCSRSLWRGKRIIGKAIYCTLYVHMFERMRRFERLRIVRLIRRCGRNFP